MNIKKITKILKDMNLLITAIITTLVLLGKVNIGFTQAVDTFQATMQSFDPKEIAEQRIDFRNKEYQAVFDEFDKKNMIKLINTNRFNYIFVGRTRVGKTTTLKTLINPFYVTQDLNIFSETMSPTLESFSVSYENHAYSLSFIDTPGLFEVAKQGMVARDNGIIIDLIAKCISMEIIKINGIFFVIDLTAGVHIQDVKALEMINEVFESDEGLINILIARSEMFSDIKKENIRKQLLEHPTLGPLITTKIGAERIFFMGSMNKDLYETDNSVIFKSMTESIFKMRKSLYDKLFKPQCEVNLMNLKGNVSFHIIMLKIEIEQMERLIKDDPNRKSNYQPVIDVKRKEIENLMKQFDEKGLRKPHIDL